MRNKYDVVMLGQNIGNNIVIKDRLMCKSKICQLSNDKRKFKQLNCDLKIPHKRQIKRYLRKVKN